MCERAWFLSSAVAMTHAKRKSYTVIVHFKSSFPCSIAYSEAKPKFDVQGKYIPSITYNMQEYLLNNNSNYPIA